MVTVTFQAPHAIGSVKSVKPGEWVTVTTKKGSTNDARAVVSVEPYNKPRRTRKDGGPITWCRQQVGCSILQPAARRSSKGWDEAERMGSRPRRPPTGELHKLRTADNAAAVMRCRVFQ